MDWSGQCQDTEGGGTHSLEGVDPWTGQGVEMPPSSCVGMPSNLLLFAQHAEESQPGGTGQDSFRAWKEDTHLLEGADHQDWSGHGRHSVGTKKASANMVVGPCLWKFEHNT